MRKAVVALLIVIGAIVAALYWLLADANRYKGPLADLLKTKTGLTVDFAGDLSWRLWPPVQLVAHDVSADWNAGAPTPLLSIKTVQLDVDLWPLITGHSRLVVDGVTLTGLEAQLVKNGETANWSPPGSEAAAPPVPIAAPGGKVQSGANTWEVAMVALKDSNLHYALDGKRYDAAIKTLKLANIAPGRTSPTRAVLTLATPQGAFDIDAQADVTTSADGQQIDVRKARIDAKAPALSLPVHAQFDAHYDVKQSSLDVTGAELALADVRGKLDVHGDLADETTWRGRIDLPVQKLDSLSMLMSPPDVTVGLSTQFTATPKSVSLSDLALTYGASTLKGSASAKLGARTHVHFELNGSEWRVASRAPSSLSIGAGGLAAVAIAAPTASAPAPADLDEPLLPLEAIRAYDWDGKLHLDRLATEKGALRNASLATSNEAGRVTASIALPEFLGGRASADVAIDASAAQPSPHWTVKPMLERVKSEELLRLLDEKYNWVALLMGGADLEMTGNTRRELATTLRGKTTFDGGQGKIDIHTIREQALQIASFAGHQDRVAAWPEVLDYKRFTGVWSVDGLQNRIDVLLDNLSLAAHGTIDPIAKTLDMAVAVTVLDKTPYPSFKVDPLLMGLAIPARCHGSIEKPDCKADKDGMKKLLQQALTGANPEARKRLDKAIDEKVPDQYKDAAHSLLDMLNKGNGNKHHHNQDQDQGTQSNPTAPNEDAPQ